MQDLLQAPVSGSDRIQRCWIYALVDPRTDRVRYVGKADDLQKRLRKHLAPVNLQVSTHKVAWLLSLVSEGLEPEVVVLEECDQTTWPERERGWIALLRAEGHDLTNTTAGGEGITGLPAESRARIGDKLRGRTYSRETLANMSAGQKARATRGDAGRPPVHRGSENSQAKLTEAQVVDLRERAAAGADYTSLANEFGISRTTAWQCVTGRWWKQAGGPVRVSRGRQRLTDEQVTEICRRAVAGDDRGVIAAEYGIDRSYITRLVHGDNRRAVARVGGS